MSRAGTGFFSLFLCVALTAATLPALPAAATDNAGADMRRTRLVVTFAESRGDAGHVHEGPRRDWCANDHANIFGPPRRRLRAINLHARDGDATRMVRLLEDGEYIGDEHETQPNIFFFNRLGPSIRAWRAGPSRDLFYDSGGEVVADAPRYADPRIRDTPHRRSAPDLRNPWLDGFWRTSLTGIIDLYQSTLDMFAPPIRGSFAFATARAPKTAHAPRLAPRLAPQTGIANARPEYRPALIAGGVFLEGSREPQLIQQPLTFGEHAGGVGRIVGLDD